MLVDNMEILCTSLGKQCVIDVTDRTDEKVIIREQQFNRNYPLYCLRWYDNTNVRHRPESGFKWKNNSIYWGIEFIKPIEYTDSIYCIECANQDEPYFTLPSGLITHNCRLQNAISDNTFSFTNGQIGVMTGSKNVITLNLNRIIQDWCHNDWTKEWKISEGYNSTPAFTSLNKTQIKSYLITILGRVYKYQEAYNELLHLAYDHNLFDAYSA